MSKPTQHPIESTFYNPKSGETYTEGVDPTGAPLVGEDDHGFNWGTTSGAWVLPTIGEARLVLVSGTLLGQRYDGAFIGRAADAIDYATRRGVRIDHVDLDRDVPSVWGAGCGQD